MDSDIFEFEFAVLEEARRRGAEPDTDFKREYLKLTTQYKRLLNQSVRLTRIGNSLERDRLRQFESVNEEQNELIEAYSRFIPQEILELLLKHSITEIQQGDHIELDLAIFFSDIRSFTTISEGLSSQEVFTLLNEYLAIVSPVIRQHGGIIDKYIGDGVMAMFPENPDGALAAAAEIDTAMAEFNERVARDWIGRDIVVGTGIHYGECILGTLGEAGRMDTTIVSDAVNLASRIEGLTKLYRRPILLSQDVFYRIEDRERFVFRFIDKLRVKGKQDTVSVFEAFHRPEKDGEAIYDFIGRFEKAVLQYYNGEFDAAMLAFNELRTVFPDDHAVQIYRKRCREKQLLKANADPQ